MRIKKYHWFILLLFLGVNVFAKNPTKVVEVGVVEHLEDTIPLDLTFYNEANDTITLGELIDKPTILSFVYFDCPGLCSPLLSGVSDVVEKADIDLGVDYQVITISFNTKDTPEKAKIKKANFVQNISKEHQEHWIYLTGEEENIKSITEAVGFKYKPQGLDFAHPSAIIVISPHGKITRYLYGLTYLPFDLKMAIIESQKGIASPTINKILQLCFSYDPAGQGYTLQITRIMATLIILIALSIFITLLIKGRRKKTA